MTSKYSAGYSAGGSTGRRWVAEQGPELFTFRGPEAKKQPARKPAVNLEGRPWYSITNEEETDASGATTKVKVLLYDAIGAYDGVTAKDFVSEINALDVDEIELHINSPGGSVYDGIAIRNALVQHDATVTVIVDGLAASAASYIALAGDEVVMAPNSELMVHDAMGICMGWAEDMQKMAEDLDRISNNIASMYAERAGGTAKDWRTVMLAETWYSADEAVKAGLADRVDGKSSPDGDEVEDVENRFDLSVFNYAGRSQAPAPMLPAASAAGVTPPAAPASGDTTQEGDAAMANFTDEQLTTLRQTAGVADDADVDTVIAAVKEALSEQAEDPKPSAVPEGAIIVDRAAFDEMREQARAGAAAREQQVVAQREQALDDAVRTGRIAPAARPGWAALLERDPAAAETLEQLPAGTIPVNELGHVGQVEDTKNAEDDQLYASVYSKEA